MEMDSFNRCDNCRSTLNACSENEGITKIKNTFCETASEIQIWNALEFIYGVSWESFQKNQLEDQNCFLKSSEDIKFCNNCASLLSENYKTLQNFESCCHPSSPVDLLKQFRTNTNNLLAKTQHYSQIPNKDRSSESDVLEDVFDSFPFEEADDDLIFSQDFESTDIKFETTPAQTENVLISDNPLSETSEEQKTTLKLRHLVIKLQKLSPDEILQFTNKKSRRKNRSRKREHSVIERYKVTKTKRIRKKPQKATFQKREPESVEKNADKNTPPKIMISGKYICNICGKAFTQYNSLKYRHWPIHQGNRKTYGCDICGKTLMRTTELKWHKLRTHGTEEEKNKWKKPCKECGEPFLKLDMRKHMAQEHPQENQRKYKCEICSVEYKSKPSLDLHVASHNEVPQKCDICSKMYPSLKSLDIHKKKIHRDKKFLCEKCPMKFISRYNLESHKAAHEDDRKLVCEECGKSFKHRGQLYTHLKCHKDIQLQEKGEKGFTCNLCNDGKKFKHSHSLRDHKKNFHPTDPNKIYECSICGKRLACAKNLTLHEKLHIECPGFKPREVNKFRCAPQTSSVLEQ